jgi:hypothetical protein
VPERMKFLCFSTWKYMSNGPALSARPNVRRIHIMTQYKGEK